VKQQILLTDDEELIRVLLSDFLEQAGYAVSMATNGKQAVELFEQNRFDLVIVDIFMPESDGLEVIRTLRAREPQLPIIAISGGGCMMSQSILNVAKALGAGCILSKPFEMQMLLDTVHDLLPPAGGDRLRPANAPCASRVAALPNPQ